MTLTPTGNPALDAVLAEMRSIADALPEGATLTDAQQTRWNELDRLARMIKAGKTKGYGSSPDAPVDSLRSSALRAVEGNPYASDDAKQLVVRSIEDPAEGTDVDALARWAAATAQPAYLAAFAKLVADPMTSSARMTTDELAAFQRVQAEARAMNLVDASGGFMVPFSLDPAVILTSAGVNDPIRDIARVVQVTTDSWNGVNSAGVTASWDGEAEEVSDDSPTLAQPSIDVHKLAAFVPFSVEVGMDAANFQAEMQRLILDSFTDAEGAAFWTGSGTGQPKGIVTALDANTNVEVHVTTNGAFAIDDVYKLHEALPPRFRRNATWAANVNVLNRIRRFGEGSTGSNSAFWTDLGSGQPPLLLGRPVVEASGMAAFTGTGSENVLIIGDFRHYVIADRVGATVELVPHLFGTTNNRPTGQRGLYAMKRTGGASVADNAFRLLQST